MTEHMALRKILAETIEQARAAERAATQDRPQYAAAPGTVTSVALTVPSIFSVTGSPVTTAGTLAVTLANQSANQVLAGPTSGGAAAPTFRALVAADIPALSYGTGTVTSVALSLPAIFSVSGSPVTTTGTLTGTLATQTANYIWAGPTTGAAAAPTFRAMVADDVPNSLITYAKIQNMATARLLGRTTVGSGVVEEISVGAGLTLTAGVLDTAGGTPLSGSGTDTYLTRWTGASTVGDSTLYLASGAIVSAIDSGLKVIRAGAAAHLDIKAEADLGNFGAISIIAQDLDGGGAVSRKVALLLDSDLGMTRVYGNLVMHTDATWDIGASGANRPRDAYLSRSLYAASLKLLGSSSGTATITPPAAAGTPTLTLPTSTGTLALTSDITTAVSGTSGKLAKFTGANAVGNSIITESGATITVAGTVTATGTYVGGANSPGSIELQRSLQRTAGYYIELGTFTSAIGTHNLRITLSIDQSGLSFARQWLVTTTYGQTGGAWWFVPTTTDSSDGSGECFLAITQTTNGLTMRLVYNGGPGSTWTHYVRVENVGNMAESFNSTSASGSGMTVPTTPLATGLSWQTRALQLVRTIPTTVGNYVEIGYFSISNGGNIIKVAISNSDGSFVVSKNYAIPMAYNEAGSWCIVGADHDTGSYSSNGWELVALQSNQNLSLRLLRTVGTTAGTAYVTVQCEGPLGTSVWVPQTGTGSMSVPTIYHPECLLTQKDGGAIVRGGYLSGDMDTMTYAATITLTVTAGNLHKTTTVHATGNATINASGVGVAGQHIWVLIVNDATGGKVITFGTNFKPNGTLTGTISKGAIVEFVSDGASWWEVARTLAL